MTPQNPTSKDVFISFDQSDDEGLVDGSQGWVSDFHAVLEKFLNQLMSGHPTVWRDVMGLAKNPRFLPGILNDISQTNLLVPVISPSYVTSSWARLEMEAFLEKESENQDTKGNNSVFKVIKTPLNSEKEPTELSGIMAYEFFLKDPETGRIREFNRRFGEKLEHEFLTKTYDLASDIAQSLELLKTASMSKPSNLTSNEKQTTVFLSFGPNDLREEYDMIKRELTGLGFRVVPDRQYPISAVGFADTIRKFLSEAESSIHLVGDEYGLIPYGYTQSVCEIQNLLAAEKSTHTTFKRLIWIKPGTRNREKSQEKFIENLKTTPALLAGADLIERPIEELKSIIIGTYFQINEQNSSNKYASLTWGEAEPDLLYLICDQEDRSSIREVSRFLYELGFEVRLPSFKGSESDVRLAHHERLAEASAIVIYYGNGTELWVDSMLKEVRKSPAYGRKSPLLCKPVILLGGEKIPEKLDFMTHQAEIMEAFEGIIPRNELSRHLQKITQPEPGNAN